MSAKANIIIVMQYTNVSNQDAVHLILKQYYIPIVSLFLLINESKLFLYFHAYPKWENEQTRTAMYWKKNGRKPKA